MYAPHHAACSDQATQALFGLDAEKRSYTPTSSQSRSMTASISLPLGVA